MKRITLFAAIILIILTDGRGSISAAEKTITITLETSGINTSSYGGGKERTWVQDEVGFGAKAVMKSGTNLQMQAANGVLYNTTPLPGRITGIKLTCEGPERLSYCFCGGPRLVNSVDGNYTIKNGRQIGEASAAGWNEDDFAEADYYYFAIKRGSNALILSKIEIIFEDSSSKLMPPAFSVAAGSYDAAQVVEIVSETEGCQIFYTTDNTNPTIESALYTEPLIIRSTTTVKAIAYKDGEVSPAAEAAYVILYPFTVTLNAGTGTCDRMEIQEAAAGEGVLLPAAISCSTEWDFAGWAGSEVDTAGMLPCLYLPDERYHPAADCMLYAVYSQGSGDTAAEDIVINAAAITGISASYAVREWTQSGISFRADQVFKGSQGGLIQLNPERGEGMLYNTTPAGGITSITVNRALGENQLTIYQGKSSKPRSSAAGSLSGDGTVYLDSGNVYFNIKAEGVLYINEIIISREAAALIYNSNPTCSDINPEPEITIITGGEGATFTDVEINQSAEYMIYLKADRITEEMTVEIKGPDKELFTYSLSGFNVWTGGYISICYNPLEAGSHTAVMEISSSGTAALVPLTGTAVNSGAGTGLNNVSAFNIYTSGGNLCFTSSAGTAVEVYNPLGQLVYQGLSTEGLNCIAAGRGPALVKIGSQMHKIIIQ